MNKPIKHIGKGRGFNYIFFLILHKKSDSIIVELVEIKLFFHLNYRRKRGTNFS